MEADKVKRLKLNWTVSEKIGQAIVNPNCFGGSPPDRDLLHGFIQERDGGWALVEPGLPYCPRDWRDLKILAFSHNRDDLVAIQWEAQTRLDRKFYAIEPPHLKVLDLERQLRKRANKPMTPLEAMTEEQILLRLKPADWEWLRQEKLAKLAPHNGLADVDPVC